MKKQIAKITFNASDISIGDIPRVRQFLVETFPMYERLHNHIDDKFRYEYPNIQFKIIDDKVNIIILTDNINKKHMLHDIFFNINHFNINSRVVNVNKSIEIIETDIGESDKFFTYKFLSPWMGLNQENYKLYNSMNNFERQKFLNKILWGNLHSVSKGFGYIIENANNIKVYSCLKSTVGKFKNNFMILFDGEFSTNFKIPNYIGLGKQSARGYGTVYCS